MGSRAPEGAELAGLDAIAEVPRSAARAHGPRVGRIIAYHYVWRTERFARGPRRFDEASPSA